MQYVSIALSLAWPQIVVAIFWFAAGLLALRYALATRRPVFTWGGLAALLIALSEILSPLRLALRYFTNRLTCPTADACTTELQFGAAKYEWLLVGLAAVLFGVGIFLEVARARRRAQTNNAARAAQQRGMPVPAGAHVSHHPASPVSQPFPEYDAALPGGYAPDESDTLAEPT